MAEVGARIRMLREALGLKQEGLANALGVDRSYVSRWESNERTTHPEAFDRLRDFLMHPLAGALDDLEREDKYQVHPDSPLARLPAHRDTETKRVFNELFSPDISDSEWALLFDKLVWPTSKKPCAESRILAGKGFAGEYSLEPPPREDVEADLAVHGEAYLKHLARAMDSQATARNVEWASICQNAKERTLALLGDLGTNVGDKAEDEVGILLQMATEEGWLEQSVCRTADDVPALMPREWNNSPEAFVYGLDLLDLVLSMLWDPDARVTQSRVRLAHEAIEVAHPDPTSIPGYPEARWSWREWRGEMVGQEAIGDFMGKFRTHLMSLALAGIKADSQKRKVTRRKGKDGT